MGGKLQNILDYVVLVFLHIAWMGEGYEDVTLAG